MKKTFSFLLIIGVLLLHNSCKKSHTYIVNETYRITSSMGSTSFLAVDLPVGYGYQSIDNIKVENADRYYFEDKGDYQTLFAEINGNGSGKTIKISYDITLFDGINMWESDTLSDYLVPTEILDVANQSIVVIAKTLTVEGDEYKTAKNISKYVSKNIRFDHSKKANQKARTASEVIASRRGVCEDYANVMTAILRASGIPAKHITGLVYKRLTKSSDWSSPALSHAWVEFYADGKWHFADPTWGNLYFDNPDKYHLSYGTQLGDIRSQSYQEMIDEIKEKEFTVIASMSSPIKFTAWSKDEKASIIPKVDIIRQ